VDKTAATRRLIELSQQADELMDDQIDRLVFRLRKTLPDFSARYREARTIVDRRGSRRATAVEPEESGPKVATATDQRAA